MATAHLYIEHTHSAYTRDFEVQDAARRHRSKKVVLDMRRGTKHPVRMSIAVEDFREFVRQCQKVLAEVGDGT